MTAKGHGQSSLAARRPPRPSASPSNWCAATLPPGLDLNGKCLKCGFELHSCKMCAYFDTSARFECSQPIPARIPRKDTHNKCTLFMVRSTIERETSTARPLDARAAFENLFKK